MKQCPFFIGLLSRLHEIMLPGIWYNVQIENIHNTGLDIIQQNIRQWNSDPQPL